MIGDKWLLVVLSLVLISSQKASALKCWKCSSTASNFCDDPFDLYSITAQQNRSAYMDCGKPFGSVAKNSHPVCKKEKLMINNKEVIARSCSWEDNNALADTCELMNSPHFCEICSIDGCNGVQLFGSSFFVLFSTLVIGIVL